MIVARLHRAAPPQQSPQNSMSCCAFYGKAASQRCTEGGPGLTWEEEAQPHRRLPGRGCGPTLQERGGCHKTIRGESDGEDEASTRWNVAPWMGLKLPCSAPPQQRLQNSFFTADRRAGRGGPGQTRRSHTVASRAVSQYSRISHSPTTGIAAAPPAPGPAVHRDHSPVGRVAGAPCACVSSWMTVVTSRSRKVDA